VETIPLKRLSKNLLSLFSADIVRRLFGFIAVAYLARILGKEGFGAVNLGFAVLAYVMVLSGAGFPTLGTKKIAQGGQPELVGSVIGSRLIATIIVLLVVVFAVLTTVQNPTITYLIILFSCAVLPQIFFVDWFFQGKETLGIVSAARVMQAFVYLAVVIIFVRTINDILWVAVGSISGECVASTLLFVRFRMKHPGVHIRIKPSLHLLKQSIPLAVGIVLTTLVINYPSLALGIFTTTSDVGTYSAASKLVYFLLMGDRILILLLLPASARKYSDSPETFNRMLTDAMRWILIISLPVAVGGILIASKLITIIYGAEYSSSIAVFQVFIWYFFITMLHTVYSAGLIGVGGDKSYGKIMLVTAFAYLVTVTAGACLFGAIGAAFGVVISEGISVLLMKHALQRVVPIRHPEKILRVILSVAIMAVCVAFVIPYGLLWGILLGIGCYSLMLILLRAVVWNDVKTLIVRF
jgi:O-antigen/teichoic acid export membrane protein